MSRLPYFVVFLALASASVAESITLNLVPAERAFAVGAEASIDLVVLNRGASEQTFTAPTALVAELSSGARSWRVELRLAAGSHATSALVAPGGFATRTYTFVVPAEAAGRTILEAQVGTFAPVRSVVDIQSTLAPPPVSRIQPAGHVAKPTTNLARAEPAASVIQRTFANRLAPHEPVYFIYGPDDPAAKIQFSFKYKLLEFTDAANESMARTLQFAFTQRSLWDIEGESSPFYDTSYMPELIFESLAPRPEEKDTWFTWLGYQAGFRHESNGRDGLVSRSLNVGYVRPVVAFGNLDGWHLLLIPELFAYIGSLDNNPDIKNYRGYGALRFVLGRNDGPSLMTTLWAGKDFDHQSLQLDLTVPIRTKLLNFETYLLVQYFDGYGESLLSYTERSETVRAGFSLVR